MNDLKNLSTDEQIKEEFEKRFGSIEKQFLSKYIIIGDYYDINKVLKLASGDDDSYNNISSDYLKFVNFIEDKKNELSELANDTLEDLFCEYEEKCKDDIEDFEYQLSKDNNVL